MSTAEIELRVTVLEKELAILKQKIEKGDVSDTPWWQKISGKFSESDNFEEAARIGREYRESLKEDDDL